MNAILLSVILVVGAPNTKEKPKDEPSIVGEWTLEKTIIGGRERPGKLEGATFVFTAEGKYLGRRNGVDVKDSARDYKIDTKKDPPQIDLSTGVPGVPMVPGIYKIEEDTLTICYNAGDGTRPTAFESTKGSRLAMTVYKRIKKKD